jgi:hypothetical protein
MGIVLLAIRSSWVLVVASNVSRVMLGGFLRFELGKSQRSKWGILIDLKPAYWGINTDLDTFS